MIKCEELRALIGDIEDPGLKKALKDINGLKKVNIGPTGIVELEISIKDKLVNEDKLRPLITKIIKQKLGFPGLRLTFHESEYVLESLRQVKYLAIGSGKGGVGKTTVTANLARALVRQGHKVGIIDADVHGESIVNMLEMDIGTGISVDQNEQMIPLKGQGIEVISITLFVGDAKPLLWKQQVLSKMIEHFFCGVKWQDGIEYILIDLPPGAGDVPITVRSLAPSSKVLVVTIPDIKSSIVAIKAGSTANKIGQGVIGVVENMSYYLNPATKQKDYIFGQGGGLNIANALGTKLLQKIPIGQPLKGGYLYENNDLQREVFDQLASDIKKLL